MLLVGQDKANPNTNTLTSITSATPLMAAPTTTAFSPSFINYQHQHQHQHHYQYQFKLGFQFSYSYPHQTKTSLSSNPPKTNFRVFHSHHFVTTTTIHEHEDEYEYNDELFEAIQQLEEMRHDHDPSHILQQINHPRHFQLLLLYFSQEGRDCWCALEVFEWLNQQNRVDQDTMDLMVSIMCQWLHKLIVAQTRVSQVVDLLVDMDCVGLSPPNFSMLDKAISVYWDLGKKDEALSFVQEVLKRQFPSHTHTHTHTHKGGGPAGYLAWKMMGEGNYRGAVEVVIHLKEVGLNPESYSYLIAMTAVVKELNEVSKGLNKLKGFARAGLVAELDDENVRLVEKYQSEILEEGIRLSSWLLQDGNSSVHSLVHEKLLAMYICCGRGLEAERELWEMKLLGKQVERYFYDIVLAICASQRQAGAVSRLLTTMEATSPTCKKKTLSWLLRGYIKGGNLKAAAETLTKLLELGLRPDYLDRIAVLQGLRRRIREPGNVDTYLKLCKYLSDADLIGPCLVYMYIKKYRLWIVKMI